MFMLTSFAQYTHLAQLSLKTLKRILYRLVFTTNNGSHPNSPPSSQPSASTRRPSHRASRKNVDVQMGNRLPRFFSLIDDQTIAAFAQSIGDFRRRIHQSRPHGGIFDCGGAVNVFTRNNENMRRRLGIDIPESNHVRILVHNLRADLLVGDLTKKAHEKSQPAFSKKL